MADPDALAARVNNAGAKQGGKVLADLIEQGQRLIELLHQRFFRDTFQQNIVQFVFFCPFLKRIGFQYLLNTILLNH
mgnify:CR=1 FL=1